MVIIMQSIEGKIKSTIYSSTSGFFVGLFRVKHVNDEDLKELLNQTITITGVILDVNDSDTYILHGKYQKHDRYGMQFQFESFEKKERELALMVILKHLLSGGRTQYVSR